MKDKINNIREILTSEYVVESYGLGIIEQFDSLFGKKTFKESVEPLMKWLCENKNPHTTVIVRENRAEIVEMLQ